MRVLKKTLTLAVVLTALSGSFSNAQAQWAAVAAPGAFLDTCVLLTDGTVMCHVYNSNRWRRLTPDINGSYQAGTWADTATMPNGTDTTAACTPSCTYAPLYFASAVLPDGRVVVVGGEYNSLTATWTNIGFMYDPVFDTWSTQLTVPFPTGEVGDAQSTVLENGTLVLAAGAGTNAGTGNLATFDPATLTFTALSPSGKADSNNEENWNILPDGTLLTVDARVQSQSEIYDPVTNTWGNRMNTAVNLADTPNLGGSAEVGPGVLRPDGTLIYFSGNSTGQNAVYDTATGTWSHPANVDFPTSSGTDHFSVADGPASLLPNGSVLVMASPVTNSDPFSPPSHFYVWDGTSLTAVADSPNAASFTSYQGRMLLLPTGEVLLTAYDQNATQDVVVYTGGGSPQNAWRPVITSAPLQVAPSSSHSISGTLFNGFSEGASYGDDAQSSTNYPLVRITNNATGHVFYARTHDHSRMGVETPGTPGASEVVTTQFDAPAGLESGKSTLVVVVNGIPSLPFTINRIPTTTTVAPATNDYHDVVTLQATVTPPGVTGTVEFFVDGSSVGFGTYNSTTGVASLAYTIQQASGSYDIRADFTSSNDDYDGSSHTLIDGLTVTLEETTLTYTGDTIIANGGTATMRALLVEDGANDDDSDDPTGTPIAGRTVQFTLGTGVTAQTCSGVTNASGIATCNISPVAQPLGPGVVSASFAGDAFYRPAVDGDTTLIFAFAEGGAFAVGNLNSSLGATVTFWSSQWSTVNSLSGGAAPPAFKGFVAGSTPPSCGAAWTTNPGNSSNPPVTVPAYMGVLVTSTVGKNGSTLSGNTARIIVVQTNAGYGPAPGHTGTGKVIAQFCP